MQARPAIGILLLGTGCFHPTYDHPRCGPNGECPKGLACSVQQSCEALGGSSSGLPDSGYDYALCPASYNVQLPGPSRYRLLPAGHPAWEQSDACNADLPGATHLVVLDTIPELLSVSAFVDNPVTITAANAVWIGGVQLRTAVQAGDGWLRFDGAPLTEGWNSGEPNDGTVEDHGEQFVSLERGQRYLADKPGATNSGALCECDGKPIAQNAADAILSNRP